MKSAGANIAFPGARSISVAQTLLVSERLPDCSKNALGTNQILSGISHFAEGWNCLVTALLHSTIAQIAKRVFPSRPWSEITDAEGLPEDSGEGKEVKHLLSPKGFHLLTALAFLSLSTEWNYYSWTALMPALFLLLEMLLWTSVIVENRGMHTKSRRLTRICFKRCHRFRRQ